MMFPGDTVCLRNVSVDTLHKGETDDDDDDDYDNKWSHILICSAFMAWKLWKFKKVIPRDTFGSKCCSFYRSSYMKLNTELVAL